MGVLEGKTALITGATRGLGREMAFAFAREGADIIVASRKAEACEATAAEIREATGRRTLSVPCHVGKWDEIERLVDAAHDEFAAIDVLVNNAGMSPLYESLTSVTEDLFDKVIAVNLRGPFRLTALVADRMSAGRGGSVINISSIASVRPGARELPYAAAKAGLNALTVGFAQAYGPAVRVNTIVAGPFLTDISRAWNMEAFERGARVFPAKRAGEPHEIVGAALYLASDASSYTTGSTIAVDGGFSHPSV